MAQFYSDIVDDQLLSAALYKGYLKLIVQVVGMKAWNNSCPVVSIAMGLPVGK